MPVLVGLVTYLALSGTPGKPETFTAKTEDTSAKGGGTGITGLVLGARPGPNYGTFAAKSAATADSRSVTDTYLVRVQFGDVTAVETALTDRYVTELTLLAVAGITKQPIDSYVPRLTFAVSALDKSQSTAKAGADSYVPVLTFTAGLVSYQKGVTDSYVPVLGMTVSVSTSDAIQLTDTYVPVLGMAYYVQAISAEVAKPVIDTYVPVLTFEGVPLVAGEVDNIRITQQACSIIRIEEA